MTAPQRSRAATDRRRIVRNVLAIARREYLWRGRSRTFLITTLLLVVVALGVALAPIVFRYIDRSSGPTKIGVVVGDAHPSIDVVVALDGLLRGTAAPTEATPQPSDYGVVAVSDIAAGRAQVSDGSLTALLALGRGTNGDLTFTLYTTAFQYERTPQLIQQAAAALAVQDRLDAAGISPIDQARLFAPPTFTIAAPDPSKPGPAGGSSVEGYVSGIAVGFALTVFIFMAIMLYGNWVAMSVAEEKSSRVMEVVLGAATPFQLLSGKVLGVGALGLTQYLAVFVPSTLALLFQDRIASTLLGSEAGAGLPTGLTIPLLLAFGALFVLGFMLYAVLYAAAASLVTRQEDVNQIVAPLTFLSVGGYIVGAYAGSGLIDPSSTLVVVLSYIPFFSPYVLLPRLAAGLAGPLDALLAMALLVASIPVALWVAARFYRAGVLMYGQRPSVRTMVRILRAA